MRTGRIDAVIDRATGLAAVGAGGVFLAVALLRAGHPFELEWMEGGCVDHVQRILDGEPIYAAPTADWVPYLYGPLYYQVAAVVAQGTGNGFLPLRLVSLLASLGTCALLGLLAHRAGGRRALAAAAAVFAASYGAAVSWWDVARVDSLFLFLVVAALAALRLGRGLPSALLAGALIAAGYLTKQTALFVAPALALAAAARAPRRALAFAATAVAITGAAVVVWDARTDGWFSFYTWAVPRAHGVVWGLLRTAARDLLPFAPCFALGAWFWLRQRRSWRDFVAHGAWSFGLGGAAVLSRAHAGGAENVLMPAHFALALLAAHAVGQASSARGRRVVGIAVLAQLALLAYDPARYLPTAADVRAGDALVERLRAASGEVLVPAHGHLPRLAGKRGAAHVMAVLDLERGPDPELGARVRRDYTALAAARGCALVVLDEPGFADSLPLVEGMRPLGVLHEAGDDAGFPVTGLQTRPQVLFGR